MNWKYLIIATARIGGIIINLQFEVAADSISHAEEKAQAFLRGYFDIDIIEIRRL